MKLTVDVELIQDTYLQIYNMCMTMPDERLRRAFPLVILYVTGTLQHFNHFMIHILLSHFWYNSTIIRLYFNCKGEVSTSVLPFYTIAALPEDGCNYLLKHVIVNEINKWIKIIYGAVLIWITINKLNKFTNAMHYTTN